jgi:hypothetical protein
MADKAKTSFDPKMFAIPRRWVWSRLYDRLQQPPRLYDRQPLRPGLHLPSGPKLVELRQSRL